MVTTAAVTVLGAGLLTASTAFAAQTSGTGQNPMDTLVQKIADKFKLNKDEVQAVFDEAHEEGATQMQADFEEQLSTYVSEGKITEAQKQLILEKRKEMDGEREANKDSGQTLSDEERKTQMESERQELETWAKQNGIDVQYLMQRGGKGHGFGGPGGFGQGRNDQSPNVTPTTTQ